MARELKEGEVVLDADGRDITNMSVLDMFSMAAENFPGSAAQLAKDFFAPFLSPVETAKNIMELGHSAINLARPGEQGNEDLARAVGEYYADRYGGLEAAKRSFAADPAGVLADVSTVFTGIGGLGRTGAKIAKLDPSRLALKAAGKVLPNKIKQAPGRLAETLIGDVATRTGGASVNQAFMSGLRGGDIGEAFRAAMRGDVPIGDVVDGAKHAVTNMKIRKNNEYLKNMAAVGKSSEPVDFDAISKALDAAEKKFRFRTRDISGAGEVIEDIRNIFEEYRIDPSMHDALGADAMKQEIWNRVIGKIPLDNKTHKTAASSIHRAIGDAINDAAPEYAKAMKDYQKAANAIKDIETTLSLKPNANIDTSVRKLQSIFRNDANTNYGRRVELGQMLEDAGAKTLLPTLAGQQMSANVPRGISGAFAPALQGVAAAATMNPLPLAMLPFQSPRLMGEAAHAAGRFAGKVPHGARIGAGLLTREAGVLSDDERFPGLLNLRNRP